MTGRWNAAIAFALIGQEWDLGVQDAPDLAGLASALEAHGWGHDQLVRHARAEVVWPHPVPDALRAGLGAAQLAAAVASARRRLSLEVLTVLPPSRRVALDPDERRLLSEVPPHHGRG